MKPTYGSLRPFVSWGRIKKPVLKSAKPDFMQDLDMAFADREDASVLPIGLGRSYGDSGINSAGRIIDMTGLDRIIEFNKKTGVVRAEAGLSINELLKLVVPHGWFLHTSPGTRFVTLGGAVANDVHGKNHHTAGSFGNAVRRVGLVRSDCGAKVISPRQTRELFRATIGGLGLTGVMSWVELQLSRIKSSSLNVERIPFESVKEFFQLADSAAEKYEHTVAWIDCATRGQTLGRGIFEQANWCDNDIFQAHRDRKGLSVPFDAPDFLLNSFTVRTFNELYYRSQRMKPASRDVPYAGFFYPLDNVGNWNRMYGSRGFYQYQCAVPTGCQVDAVQELIGEIVKSQEGSFLAVLKTLGPKPSKGYLSFPCRGATLALDFPNRGNKTLKLFSRLDRIVQAAGGRLYPAKDGRLPAMMFQNGYPELEKFRMQIDPALSSDFWRRVAH